ncbi:MAG: HAD-IIIA family hydrolase [Planctomycetota bacterium]
MGSPAVFLDRDDTLNVNAQLPDEAFPGTWGDLYCPDWVKLLPGAADACARLAGAGYTLVIITNQGGAARGHATIPQIEATTARVCELIDEAAGCDPDQGPLISASYAAPHHPDAVVDHLRAAHPWRKGGPGMVLAAAHELDLDLGQSWMIGDKDRDLEAAIGAGVPADRCLRISPDHFPSLANAADHVLRPAPPQVVGPMTTVTLRATGGTPLTEPGTRSTVESAARALAERTGIALHDVRTDTRSITVSLGTHRLAAMGFLTELRNATNRWYESRNPGDVLWPTGQVDTPEGNSEDDWDRDWHRTPEDDG